MKIKYLSLVSAPAVLLASCAQKAGVDDYDVSNPYSAPDYVDDSGTPFESPNLEPTYDVPAAYEEAAPAPVGSTATAAPVLHTVVRGDTLWGLGNKYGVSVDAIKSANGMTRDTVVLGSKLQIPSQ